MTLQDVSSSSPSLSFQTAALPSPTVLDGLRPALLFLVPLFSGVLLVRAGMVAQHIHTREQRSEWRRQKHIARVFVGLLAMLCIVSGAMLLTHEPKPQAEAFIGTLLSLFLGVPVVHLPQFINGTSASHRAGRLLAILLSSATCVALLAVFHPQISSLVFPAIFLIYSVAASLRVSFVLYQFYKQPKLLTATAVRPIAIHVATHRTSTGAQQLAFNPHQRLRHQKGCSIDSTASSITSIDHIDCSLSPPPAALVLARPILADVEYQSTAPSISIDNHTFQLQAQVIHNRTRNLLVYLFAAQLCNLCAYSCAIGTAASIHSFSSSSLASRAAHRIQVLQVTQTACTVLSVLGTMSAYLLHAYNAHVGSLKLSSLVCLPKPFSKSRSGSKKVESGACGPAEPSAPKPTHPSAYNLTDNGTSMAAQMAPSLASSLHPSAFPNRTPSGRRKSHHRRNTNQLYRGYPDASGPSQPRVPPVPPTPIRPAPIVLTYQPPKSRTMSDGSLFETTDDEGCERALADAQFDTQEQERKCLVNAHSYTSMKTNGTEATKVESAANRDAEVAREEQTYGYSKRGKRVSTVPTTVTTTTTLTSTTTGTIGTTTTTSTTGPMSTTTSGGGTITSSGSGLLSSRSSSQRRSKGHRRKKFEDPAVYIKKRGAIPQPQRKVFGGISWSSIGLHCMAARSSNQEPFPIYNPRLSSASKHIVGEAEYLQEGGSLVRPSLENADSSWIDLEARGDSGLGSGGLLSAFRSGDDKEKGRERDFRKSKRNTAPATPNLGSQMEENPALMVFGQGLWDDGPFTGATPLSIQAQRKLKKRVGIVPTASAPSSRPGTAESNDGSTPGAFGASGKFIRVDVETRVVSDVVEDVEIVPLPKKVAALLGEEKRVVKKPIVTASPGVGLRARRSLRDSRTLGPSLTLGRIERQALSAYAVQDEDRRRHPFSAIQKDEEQVIEIDAVMDEKEMEEFRQATFGASRETKEGSRPGSPTPTPTPTATPRTTKFPTSLKSSEIQPPLPPAPTPERKANISRRIMDPPRSPPTTYEFPVVFPNSMVSSSEQDESSWLRRASSTLASLPTESLPPPPPRHVKTSSKRHIPARPRNPEPPIRATTYSPRRSTSTAPHDSPSRLSTNTFGNVKNALGLVHASGSNAKATQEPTKEPAAVYAFGGEIIPEDETEGDFTNLRDPFASPTPALKVRKRGGSVETTYEFTVAGGSPSSQQSSNDIHGHSSIEDILAPHGGKGLSRATRMSAWGRLPMPEMAYSNPREVPRVPATVTFKEYAGSISSGSVKAVSVKSRRKDKRSKRSSRTSSRRVSRLLDEDAVEEALLSQRLLRRLDGEGWAEVRS